MPKPTKLRQYRPHVAIVAWKLGGELERVIELGADRFAFSVVSMLLREDLRRLVRWYRMPLLPLSSFRIEWATFFAIGGVRVARIDADLIHTIGPTPIVPNRVDLNTVTFCHAAYHEAAVAGGIRGTSFGWQLGEPSARMLERWWFDHRVRVVAALSAGGAADLRRHYPRHQVVVLPRGVDLARFSPNSAVRAAVRAQLGVDAHDLIGVFVDQQARPLKGLDIALEAVAAARAQGAPWRLWVVGAGNEPYERFARDFGIGDAVRFFGRRDDVERFYQAADAFVLPTAFETFSRSAHEAAACSLPIVATRVSGIQELIGEDEAGIAVARDAADVARALLALAGDEALRTRLGQTARARAAAYDVDASAARILGAYESLVRRLA